MVRVIKIVIISILLVSLFGCGGKRKEAGQQNQPDTISAYGITLTKESSPKEVASLLIKGLDNDDEDVLTKLVAVKNEMAEIKKVFQKHGQRAKKLTPEDVASLTAKGWMASYAFLEPGWTKITDETIEGDRAYVYCVARNPKGRERNFEIRLIREDGWWKVTAGLHSQ
uniref:DUF4878 domain-containing protein n=1 Tax=candidate division WOR-3 bacterium TaxID=2052148 RepID=A0A7C6ECP3_UNCW3